MGTLLAFTMVAISVLILRYVPPDEVPLPSSLQESIDSVSLRYSQNTEVHGDASKDGIKPLLPEKDAALDCPILLKQEAGSSCKFLLSLHLNVL